MSECGQRGSILLTLLGVLVTLGVLVVLGATLLMPRLSGMSRSNLMAATGHTLTQAAYTLTAEAVENASGIPVAKSLLVAAPAPSGGGQIPAASAAAKVDAWATPIGYCTNAAAAQGDPVFAVVSAGPDKVFQTTCAQALAGTKAGDDGVRMKTVANIKLGVSGVVYFGDPVATLADLVALPSVRPGEVRLVRDVGTYVNQAGTPGAAGWVSVQNLSSAAVGVSCAGYPAGTLAKAASGASLSCESNQWVPAGLATSPGEGQFLRMGGANGQDIYVQNINGAFRVLNSSWSAELLRIDQNGLMTAPRFRSSGMVSCETGFVPVGAFTLPDGEYVPPFCVMQYEAHRLNNGVITADVNVFGATTPIRDITFQSAKGLCNTIGANLIAESQWLSIAHQVTTVASNWSGGAVGSGTLARGWSANTAVAPGDAWSNAGSPYGAPLFTTACLYNTGADACGATGQHLYRRTLTLPNGSVVWDMSGNFWEYVDTTVPVANRYAGNVSANTYWSYGAAINGYSSITNSIPLNKRPPNGWTSAQGMGLYTDGQNLADAANNVNEAPYAGNSDQFAVFIRGGGYLQGAGAGVFELSLGFGRSAWTNIGLRCTRSQ